MLCYKLIAKVEGKRYSAICYGESKIEYIVGKPAVVPEFLARKGYYPTVFGTLEQAVTFENFAPNFYEGFGRTWIWVAECTDPVVPIPPRLNRHLLAKGIFVQTPDHRIEWPRGTLMFKNVTLVEPVD